MSAINVFLLRHNLRLARGDPERPFLMSLDRMNKIHKMAGELSLPLIGV
jgi:hypothetical protein